MADINALIKSGFSRREATLLAAQLSGGGGGGGGGGGTSAYEGITQLQGATFSTSFTNNVCHCTISTWMAPVQQSYAPAAHTGPSLHVGTNGNFDLMEAGLYRFSVYARLSFVDHVNGTDLPHSVVLNLGTAYEGAEWLIPTTTGAAGPYITGTGVFEQRDLGPYWFDAYNASNGDQGSLSLKWDSVSGNATVTGPSGQGNPQLWMYVAKVG